MHRPHASKGSPTKSVVLVALFLLSISVVLAVWGALGTTAVFSANSTLYAAPTQRGSANCSSWGNACRLSTALGQATSGDEIWVEEGIHYPTTSSSNISETLQLANGIALYGGFDGTEATRAGRDWAQNITVLSGDIEKNDNTNADGILTDPDDLVGQNSYHVVMALNVSETAIIDGFTITGGVASSSEPAGGLSHDSGGGLYNQNSLVQVKNVSFIGNQAFFAGGAVHNANSDVTLENVYFDHNFAVWEGGAINSVQSSDITISNSEFINNVAGLEDNMATGGAIYHASSEMLVTSTTFDDNSTNFEGGAVYHFSADATYTSVSFLNNSAENGGAIYNRSSDPIFNEAIFQGNEATEYGGAMYSYLNSDPILSNALLTGNFAELGAGAMFNFFSSSPVLNNVTVSGNETNGATGGITSIQLSDPEIVNSIFWNNKDSSGTGTLAATIASSSATIKNSIIQGSGGSSSWNNQAGTNLGNNLDVNPQFVSQPAAASAPTTNGDFNLQESSPAINAGDTAAYEAISASNSDLAGNARVQNGIIDMGPYESAFAPSIFLLSIELIGSGDGQLFLDGDPLTCNGSCTVEFDPDTAVSLTATPDANSTFAGWGGDCSGTGSCNLTMDSAKSITANFDALPVFYPLTIELIGTGGGQLFLDGDPLTCSSSCEIDILEDSAVTLTATPDNDSTFVGWGGDCSGTGSCNLTMSSAMDVTVNFDQIPVSYPLSIEVAGSGGGDIYLDGAILDCDNGCTVNILENTDVTLTATPNGGSTFAGWAGACQGSGSCQITMDSPKGVTANFNDNQEPLQFQLSINVIGSGSGQLFLNNNPIVCNNSCAFGFDADTAVSLSASALQNSSFIGWSGDCQGTGFCDLIMDSAKTITVNFAENGEPILFPLTIDLIGTGAGQLFLDGDLLTCNGSCTIEIEEDSAVSLTATPDANSIFAGWGGACEGTESCDLTMDSAKSITASFIRTDTAVSYSLSIEKLGEGTGQLFMNGDPLDCDSTCTLILEENTAVTLTATPDDSSVFAGWGGGCIGDDSCELTMDSSKEVTATFDIEEITITEFIIYLPLIER